MARQGGDNRAFTSPYGRVLLYARLVLEAMCNDTTEAGKRFAKERQDIQGHRFTMAVALFYWTCLSGYNSPQICVSKAKPI